MLLLTVVYISRAEIRPVDARLMTDDAFEDASLRSLSQASSVFNRASTGLISALEMQTVVNNT